MLLMKGLVPKLLSKLLPSQGVVMGLVMPLLMSELIIGLTVDSGEVMPVFKAPKEGTVSGLTTDEAPNEAMLFHGVIVLLMNGVLRPNCEAVFQPALFRPKGTLLLRPKLLMPARLLTIDCG